MIDVEYDVCTNTAALPTVNALFHSIVSTHSHLATIDIVDYYLGAIYPSFPTLSLSASMCPPSPSLPSQNLVSYLSSATPTAKPSSSVMS
jgi:hypothetical protein